MKKSLLVGLITASLSFSAFAEPTLYGKANVSYQVVSEDGVKTTEVKSNASRIGVKGSLNIEGGLQAIYQAEFEVQFDDGDKDGETFTQRDIFIGLKGDFGIIKAGKYDTPFKLSQNKVDLFNDLEGDIKNSLTVNDNRANNSVSYHTPELSGFQGNIAIISSEEDDVNDGVSLSFTYDYKDLYVAVAHDQDVEGEGRNASRAVAQYTLAGFQIGALYEAYENEFSNEDTEALFASLQYKFSKFALKGQYGVSDVKNEGAKSFSVGVDYKLAKQLKVFAYRTQNSHDDAENQYYSGVGVELKF